MSVLLNLGAGVLVGILANLGFGPITILAVTRRLQHGIRAGMDVGVVASFLDGLTCFLAAQAAGFVTSLVDSYSAAMKAVGSVILVSVAVGLIRHARTLEDMAWRGRPDRGHPSAVIATVLLYISNPVIGAFWLTASGVALTYGLIDRGVFSALFFAAGCAAGGILRYLILMKVLLRSAERIRLHLLRKVILGLSVLLIGIALYGLLDVFVIDPARRASQGLGEPEKIEARFEEVEIGFEDLGVEGREIPERGGVDVGFALRVVGVAHDLGAPQARQGAGPAKGIVEIPDLIDKIELEGLPGREHPSVGGLPQFLFRNPVFAVRGDNVQETPEVFVDDALLEPSVLLGHVPEGVS
jgi:threonine/homoserine/homoserine lactone efflux protein